MNSIQLIKGKFSPEEAKEILLEIIGRKINFHNLKHFSSKIRFDEPDLASQKRIEELTLERDKVLALVEEAKLLNTTLQIDSVINIAFESTLKQNSTLSEVKN